MNETLSLSREFEKFLSHSSDKRINLISIISNIGFNYLMLNHKMEYMSIDYYKKILGKIITKNKDDLETKVSGNGSHKNYEKSSKYKESHEESERNHNNKDRFTKRKNSIEKKTTSQKSSIGKSQNEILPLSNYMKNYSIFPEEKEANGQIDKKTITNLSSSNRDNSNDFKKKEMNLIYSDKSSYDRLNLLLIKESSKGEITNHHMNELNGKNNLDNIKSQEFLNNNWKNKNEYRKRKRDDSISESEERNYKKYDNHKDYHSKRNNVNQEKERETIWRKSRMDEDKNFSVNLKERDSNIKIKEEKVGNPIRMEKIMNLEEKIIVNSGDSIIIDNEKNSDQTADMNKLVTQSNKNFIVKETESAGIISIKSQIKSEENMINKNTDATCNKLSDHPLHSLSKISSKNYNNFTFSLNCFTSFYKESLDDSQLKSYLFSKTSSRLRFLKDFSNFKKLVIDKRLKNILNSKVSKVCGMIKVDIKYHLKAKNIFSIELEKDDQVQTVFVTENILKNKLNTNEIVVKQNEN